MKSIFIVFYIALLFFSHENLFGLETEQKKSKVSLIDLIQFIFIQSQLKRILISVTFGDLHRKNTLKSLRSKKLATLILVLNKFWTIIMISFYDIHWRYVVIPKNLISFLDVVFKTISGPCKNPNIFRMKKSKRLLTHIDHS